MGLSDEEQDSMGGSTAVMDGQMKTQIKKAKQHRGTAKGKFTRKIEKFFLACENKADLKVLEDKYNLIVKGFEEVAFANENYCNLFDET